MASGSSGPLVDGNIQLGNCIGKGAFGMVWRGLNVDTAATVAVKQVDLSDIPKAELANIMMEIDLLKKLNHPNIVKYIGFEKSKHYLNIILELCENGSLRSLCKNFGKLPEHLGAMYIAQVLDGLIYLHEQGVIHRDIKGANILATKDGLVKLADFGVATLSADAAGEMSVAGTPYWMAPEIIELSGATTASDIWSVGCTVIELLDGEPPYHDLPPMGALYRIVQDDHPPIPESVSAIVKDFLMQCFQKDCNLRVSAKKLSKHPWIQMSKKKTGSQRSRDKPIPAYDEAVKSVQQWNEALKGTTANNSSIRMTPSGLRKMSETRDNNGWHSNHPEPNNIIISTSRPPIPERFTSPLERPQEVNFTPGGPTHFHLPNNVNVYEPEESTDNWDDDFMESIGSIRLAALEFREQDEEVSKTIRAPNAWGGRRASPVAHRGPPPMQLVPPMQKYDEHDVFGNEDDDEESDDMMENAVNALEVRRNDQVLHSNMVVKPTGSLASRPKGVQYAPVDLARSRSEPGLFKPPSSHLTTGLSTANYMEDYQEKDEEDFSDLFGPGSDKGGLYQDEALTLQTRLSNHSWFGDDAGSDEEDPFAEMDESFEAMDLEANIARDKYARTCASIAELFKLLEAQTTEKELASVCDQLMTLLIENPDMRGPMIANHGVIPLLDLIEAYSQPSLILKLLTIINLVIRNDFALQESLCLVGAIPVLIKFTSKRYGSEIQQAAASFIQQMCHTSTLTLQMFISCRGLRVLIDFLEGNYTRQRELIWIAVNGIHSVFELQTPTPRNDFCRLLAKQGLLDPLASTLYSTIRDPEAAAYTEKIVHILLIFSQGDSSVKELLATRQIIHGILSSLGNLPIHLCVTMLKCIKNISMNSNTLDVLQNSNAIQTLTQVLEERTEEYATDICNHVLTTIYNLCRINKSRQIEAAKAGIIPRLQQIAESTSPLKQFALPVLCDLAHAGTACRNILWNNDCLPVYLRLLKDPYWQVNALDAILVWLQDEISSVQQVLVQPASLQMIIQAFLTAKANSFENLLEPLHKIMRISPSVARGLADPALFNRLLDRLAHPKAVVRLNLLRILRAIFESHPDCHQLVALYGIDAVVHRIAIEDPAVLVKELAREIMDTLEESDSDGFMGDESRFGSGASNSSVMIMGRLPGGPAKSLTTFDNNSQDDVGTLRFLKYERKMEKQRRTPTLEHKWNQRRPSLQHDNHSSFMSGAHVTTPKANASVVGSGSNLKKSKVWSQHVSSNDADAVGLLDRREQQHAKGPSRGRNMNHVIDSDEDDRSEEDEEGEEDSDELRLSSSSEEDEGGIAQEEDGDEGVDDDDNDAEEDEEPEELYTRQRIRQSSTVTSTPLNDLLVALGGDDHDAMSDSVVLRSELPKLPLGLLDLDRFPGWDRKILEQGYDDDEGDEDEDETSKYGTPAVVTADMTKMLREYHGARRRPSGEFLNAFNGGSNGYSMASKLPIMVDRHGNGSSLGRATGTSTMAISDNVRSGGRAANRHLDTTARGASRSAIPVFAGLFSTSSASTTSSSSAAGVSLSRNGGYLSPLQRSRSVSYERENRYGGPYRYLDQQVPGSFPSSQRTDVVEEEDSGDDSREYNDTENDIHENVNSQEALQQNFKTLQLRERPRSVDVDIDEDEEDEENEGHGDNGNGEEEEDDDDDDDVDDDDGEEDDDSDDVDDEDFDDDPRWQTARNISPFYTRHHEQEHSSLLQGNHVEDPDEIDWDLEERRRDDTASQSTKSAHLHFKAG